MFKKIISWLLCKPIKEEQPTQTTTPDLPNYRIVFPDVKPLDEYNPEVRKLALVPDMKEFAESLKFDNDTDVDVLNLSYLSDEAKLKIRQIYNEDLKRRERKYISSENSNYTTHTEFSKPTYTTKIIGEGDE